MAKGRALTPDYTRLASFLLDSRGGDYEGLRGLLLDAFGQYREIPEDDPLRLYLDDALRVCEGVRRPESERRQLEVIRRRYVEGLTRRQLAQACYCDVSTIQRDTDAALDILMVAVFGVRGIRTEPVVTLDELAAQVVEDVRKELPRLLEEGVRQVVERRGCNPGEF